MPQPDSIPSKPGQSQDDAPESHDVEIRYVPKATGRSGTALCLSGGGFRAALFHLGALRRLNELGVLSQIDTITSVSGGSVMSAHLADRIASWPEQGTVLPDWETRIAAPFRAFVKKDICTVPALKLLLPWSLWTPGIQAKALADRYYKRLTKLSMSDLPKRPRFIFCATDLFHGDNYLMYRPTAAQRRAGLVQALPTLPVATAVAASSCFPPVFRPIPLPFAREKLANMILADNLPARSRNLKIRLTDGGVYDNMGLEPVWKDHARVLVSDGGAPFRFRESKTFLNQIQRSIDVVGKQSVALRKRWLISSFIKNIMQGAYWGIGSSPQRYAPHYKGYSKPLAWRSVSAVRTDMNAFTDAEIGILENHGYLLAEAAIRQHEKELIAVDAPLAIPHPHWMNERDVERALKKSHKRITLKRLTALLRS